MLNQGVHGLIWATSSPGYTALNKKPLLGDSLDLRTSCVACSVTPSTANMVEKSQNIFSLHCSWGELIGFGVANGVRSLVPKDK